MMSDLVSVEDEGALVQAHTKIHDKLINTFDEEEVSKTKCLEVCMRYRSELIDWMGRQIQEVIYNIHQLSNLLACKHNYIRNGS